MFCQSKFYKVGVWVLGFLVGFFLVGWFGVFLLWFWFGFLSCFFSSMECNEDKCKVLPLKGIMSCNDTGSRMTGWGAALLKRPGDLGGQQAEDDSEACPGSKEGQQHPEVY